MRVGEVSILATVAQLMCTSYTVFTMRHMFSQMTPTNIVTDKPYAKINKYINKQNPTDGIFFFLPFWHNDQ